LTPGGTAAAAAAAPAIVPSDDRGGLGLELFFFFPVLIPDNMVLLEWGRHLVY
jgi:hypothetical protein